MPPACELEALLREERWLRKLARRLVADPNEAEDLVQETWVAALAARRPGSLTRAWMGSVLRNLWRDLLRGRERHERRERAVARDEATQPLDELAAELELRQLVGRCLLELAEPYRRALTLRFLREQSLKALARSEGISVTSAHERVERGLAELRARLDRERGGRRSWALGLMSLARPAGLAVTGLGGIAMGTGIKVGATLLVLVGLGAWLLRAPHLAAKRAASASSAPLAETPRAAPTGSLAPTNAPSREPGVEATGAMASPTRNDVQATLRGRVLDPQERPLEGIPLALVDRERWTDGPDDTRQTSAADGGFEFELAPDGPADPAPVALDPARATLLRENREGEWLLVLSGMVSLAGRVEDQDGAPVAGAGLAVDIPPAYFRELGIARPFEYQGGSWRTVSAASGAFALPAVPGGAPAELRVWAPGFRPRCLELPARDEAALGLVLERQPDLVPLTGFVLDPLGRPVEGARVSAGGEITRTAADGGFAFSWRPGDGYQIVRPDGVSLYVGATHIAAAHEGFAPARAELAQLDLAQPIVLQLGEDLAIAGRVVGPGGDPLAEVAVWITNPTHFGQERGEGHRGPIALEGALHGAERGVVTREDGSFALGGLLPQEYHLLAYDPRTAACAGPFTVAAGTSAATLVLDRESGTGRVAGRIVDAQGEPLAGALVRPRRSIDGDFVYEPALLAGLEPEVTTDEEGRFEFARLARAGTHLAIMHPQGMLQVELADFIDLERLEIVAPVLCELQIDLGGQAGLATRARVHDADGRLLWVFTMRGSQVTLESTLPIQGGKSDVVSVSHAAATVVLMEGGQEVARRPVALDPARITVVRP